MPAQVEHTRRGLRRPHLRRSRRRTVAGGAQSDPQPHHLIDDRSLVDGDRDGAAKPDDHKAEAQCDVARRVYELEPYRRDVACQRKQATGQGWSPTMSSERAPPRDAARLCLTSVASAVRQNERVSIVRLRHLGVHSATLAMVSGTVGATISAGAPGNAPATVGPTFILEV